MLCTRLGVAHLLLLLASELVQDAEDSGDAGSQTAVLSCDDPRTKHVRSHLKKQDDDTVAIGVINGGVGRAMVRWLEAGHATDARLQCLHLTVAHGALVPPPARPNVDLVLGMPQPKCLLRLWPVLASMGVSRIIVVSSALSDPAYNNASALRPDLYAPLIQEGMAQAGDPRVPSVLIRTGTALEEALCELESAGAGDGSSDDAVAGSQQARLLLDLPLPGGGVGAELSVRQALLTQARDLGRIARTVLAIGPERGWTSDEAHAFASDHRFVRASLGPATLRTDVACAAGLALAGETLRELLQLQLQPG